MPGLVPGIHVFDADKKIDVDGRVKPGHDGRESAYSAARLAALVNFFSTRSRFSFDR
jgi:hypothetical protein